MPRNDFGASCSLHPVPSSAIGEVVGDVLEQVGSGVDLAIIFATAHLTGTFDDLLHVVRSALQPRVLLGATASAVFANGTEVERQQGVALWAGRVGEVVAFALDASGRRETADHTELTIGTGTDLDAAAAGATALLVLGDPFSFPAQEWLQAVERRWPGLPVFGGFASAANARGGNRLAVDDRVVSAGAVGAFFRGPVRVRTVVSQGCRPIGRPFTVTKSERNVIYELGGLAAVERLDATVAGLSAAERIPLRNGVHLGIVIDEHQLDFDRGDFLVRSVLGADRATGAIAVDHEVDVGMTVQFHSRDADSASDDLGTAVLRAMADTAADGSPVRGGLLFRCTGRGPAFFGRDHHDAGLVFELTGAPLAGLSCAGEFGSVGARNFVHTYTASIALFS